MKQCRRPFCILFSLFLLTFSSGCARESAAASGQKSDQQSSQLSEDDSGSFALEFTREGPFRLENAEQEVLDWDGMDLTGTMKYWDMQFMTGASHMCLSVPATETLTFTPQRDDTAILVSGHGQLSYVEGTGITSVVVKDSCVSLEGDRMDFSFIRRLIDSSLPDVRLDSHADGAVTITASAEEFSAKGISGDYILQTMYSKDDIISKEVGFAEPGEVISQAIRGR